jgi:Flp pilus assembly protein TadD
MNLRAFWNLCLIASACFIEPVYGENVRVVLHGKVVLLDGAPPPASGAVERVCSDGFGSAPGPLVDKKGEFIWAMDVDPMRTRACTIRATHAGYTSTAVDISALHGYLDKDIFLQPIVITSQADDPYSIVIKDSMMPGKAASYSKKAMKAMDEFKYPEAAKLFQDAVREAPKFAQGWHALGVLSEYQSRFQDARQAYESAIEANPKFLPPYMTLVRLCVKSKDWQCAGKISEALIEADKKKQFTEIHMHRAVALYGLKDLDSALASVQEAIRLDPYKKNPRTEYILGRILKAKGDINGARDHITKYLELDKKAPDLEMIRMELNNLGRDEASGALADLENL